MIKAALLERKQRKGAACYSSAKGKGAGLGLQRSESLNYNSLVTAL